MTRTGKLVLLLIMVGVFVPFFFRVGWGQPSPTRGQGFFGATSRIVIRESVFESDDPNWYERWVGGESPPEVDLAGVSWPARRTDLAGLSLAFVGVVMLVLRRPSLHARG
jgi:hypothetical protein